MLTSLWKDFNGVGVWSTNSRLGSNVSPFSTRSHTEIPAHAPEDNRRRIRHKINNMGTKKMIIKDRKVKKKVKTMTEQMMLF